MGIESEQEEVRYQWRNRRSVPAAVLDECSELFSRHYGVWSLTADHRPGQPIALSPARLKRLLACEGTSLSLAYSGGRLVGHAISLRTNVEHAGYVSWVTQLVVDQHRRRQGIATRLLNSIWAFSTDFAWGLVTANPYTVRTLEKATRRRCSPAYVGKHVEVLRKVATDIPYVKDAEIMIDERKSVIDTKFEIDHSSLPGMLKHVQPPDWRLGPLREGEEWLAFTFSEQPRRALSAEELESILQQSEQILREAYGRMALDAQHKWAAHTAREIDFVLEHALLRTGAAVVDFGCGRGRHVLELARRGIRAVGVDFLGHFVETARAAASSESLTSAEFIEADCRSVTLGEEFDLALCLYDVFGSFAKQEDNLRLLGNLVRHIKPGGFLILSAMNMDLTRSRAKHTGDVFERPDLLSRLRPGNIMQKTGDIFDPEYYLLDTVSGVVYRKEQFSEDGLLSAELVVRDRRYTREEIVRYCAAEGVDEVLSRNVRAGNWLDPLGATDARAKEVLFVGRKRYR